MLGTHEGPGKGATRVSPGAKSIRSTVARLQNENPDVSWNELLDLFREEVKEDPDLSEAVDIYAFTNAYTYLNPTPEPETEPPEAKPEASAEMPKGHPKSASASSRATKPDLSAVAKVCDRLFLDELIDGVPLRRAKVVDADAWADRNLFKGRVIKRLLINVPLEGLVGDHVTDAVAEQVREEVSKE